MSLFSQRIPPSFPLAPDVYDSQYMNKLVNTMRLYFTALSAPQNVNLAGIMLDLDTLPTQADTATLRAGTVYRDTTADNVLKVKV
jgi:hypothetical protein